MNTTNRIAPKTLVMNAAIAFTCIAGAAAAQELVSNGSFEDNSCNVTSWLPVQASETCLTDWTVTGGGVELVRTVWISSDGEYSVELADFADGGGIEQTLGPTVIGQQYRVSFALAGQPDGGVKSMRVEIDSGAGADFQFDTAGQSGGDMGWQRKTWCFTATSTSTTLKFLATNVSSAFNAAIDDVSVVPAEQNLVTNGSFEDNGCNVTTWTPLQPGETCLTGWDVTGGGIELVRTVWTSSDGDYSVELADFADAGGIEQQLSPTIIGQDYRVTLRLAGQPDGGVKSMRIEVDDGSVTDSIDLSFDTAGQSGSNMGWQLIDWTFTATSTNTTLRFLATDVTSAFNAAIDDVRVVAVGDNLVTNGSFENNGCNVIDWIPLQQSEACLTGWNVLGGGVELVRTVWTSPDGEYSVELADFADAGGIEQVLSPTVPGQRYRASFRLAGQPDGNIKLMRIEVDNGQGANFQFDTAGKTGTDMGWQATEWFFTATSTSTTLRFLATNVTSPFNAAIDDVRVEAVFDCIWIDDSCALAGVNGDPLLFGTGPLSSDSFNTIELVNAASTAPALLFFALSDTPVPFKGGTLKALPLLALPAFMTDATGSLSLPFVLPATPAGLELWFQWAIQDAAAVHGVALSNALYGVTQ